MIYPTDIDSANAEWGANCGPCSIAALLNKQVNDVRPFLGAFEKRPYRYMNINDLQSALTAAGARWRWNDSQRPQHGLVFVQWGGHEKRPVKAQYKYTHTIAVDGNLVFEVNADELVGWAQWEAVMPKMMKEAGQGNGGYFIRGAIEVSREGIGRPLHTFDRYETRILVPGKEAVGYEEPHKRENGFPCAALGPELFRFNSYRDWVEQGQRFFRKSGYNSAYIVCIDQKGRICPSGKEFQIARDERAFPVVAHLSRSEPESLRNARTR